MTAMSGPETWVLSSCVFNHPHLPCAELNDGLNLWGLTGALKGLFLYWDQVGTTEIKSCYCPMESCFLNGVSVLSRCVYRCHQDLGVAKVFWLFHCHNRKSHSEPLQPHAVSRQEGRAGQDQTAAAGQRCSLHLGDGRRQVRLPVLPHGLLGELRETQRR